MDKQSSSSSRRKATFVGFTAVILWGLLALFTAASGTIPPFQLAAMCFAIGALLGMVSWIKRGVSALKQPAKVWILGVTGLFGYHFFYFTALRNAPPVEAGLIAYLWPLLIVLFSAMLPGERLRWFHVAGAILGLLGTGLIVTGGGGFEFKSEYAFGYSAAALCAIIWSGYSVISRRFGAVPTDVVVGFCLACSFLAAISHIALETTVWPETTIQWLAVLGLGLGPLGTAFYAWDYGVKNGDIAVLGAASYLAPLLSTLVLIATGYADFTLTIALACLAITLGAILAAKDFLFSKSGKT